ncbi:MAG: SDR family oxidoreductase [Candidatus Caenarcaniphilales bacterium]|nr:SDR family oxidoreductase [Candidatus Caenarcaniphilales bacterium]
METFYKEHNLPPAVQPQCPINKTLKVQKALVTGASSGIGQAIAISLGQAGADVLVNYASDEKGAKETAAEIERCGSKTVIFKADVSQESEVLKMFEAFASEIGKLDILVNNAGLQKDAPLEEMTAEQWDRVINVNLRGQFLCAREAVKIFKNHGVKPEISCAAGKIICTSSVHDIIPWAGHVNYAASKGGVMMLMKSIAQEVAPYRIRVNSISPGAIRTPINTEAWSTPEAYAGLMKLIPYKRIGEANEIGRAAVWLASDDSDYITGETLYIDGGMTLYPGFEAGG